MTCPHCQADMPPADSFCEECGNQLARPPVETAANCLRCDAGPDAIDADGFCSSCGVKRQAQGRDHMEIVISPSFAGVSDRGLKHQRNEDFFAMLQEADGRRILVACDGVSSTVEADRASEAAAESTLRALVRGSSMANAIAAAQKAVCEISQTKISNAESPATTIVAALVEPRTPSSVHVTVGWLGDSRAYWVSSKEVKQLTQDHSWITEIVASGKMDEEQALASSQAHAITRWLGSDAVSESGSALEPSISQFEFSGPGTLLLCTDGLWNYASDPESIAKLLHSASGDALAKARELVTFANEKGGHDNITVILFSL